MNAMKEKLVSICTPRQWKTLSTSELKDEGYTVYGANGVIGYYNEYNHEVETVMVTCRGATCGTVNISKPYSYINGNAMCMDDLRHDIDVKYLYYALKHYDFREVISGSAQPQITRQSLNNVFIEVVGQNKQLEIVKILSNIEESIITKQRLLYEYDQLIKSRFVEMFGDPIQNNKGFKTKLFVEACPFNTYKGQVRQKEGKYWILNLDMIESNTGKVIEKIYQPIEEIGNSIISFDTECVLYSKLRPYLNKVVIPDTNGYGTSELIHMKTGDEVNKYYLAELLRSNSFVSYINSKTAGAKMPRVSMDYLRNFKLMIPDMKDQLEFESFAKQVNKLKFVVQKSLDETQKLFDSLMQEYFG
jgi:type I restriction enzyme S subunit